MKYLIPLFMLIIASCRSKEVATCDNSLILKTANDIIHDSPLVKAIKKKNLGQIGKLNSPGEVEYDKTKDIRICRAQIKDTDGSDIWVKFKVSWHNKDKDEFFIEFME